MYRNTIFHKYPHNIIPKGSPIYIVSTLVYLYRRHYHHHYHYRHYITRPASMNRFRWISHDAYKQYTSRTRETSSHVNTHDVQLKRHATLTGPLTRRRHVVQVQHTRTTYDIT